jgi:hypothetical protein
MLNERHKRIGGSSYNSFVCNFSKSCDGVYRAFVQSSVINLSKSMAPLAHNELGHMRLSTITFTLERLRLNTQGILKPHVFFFFLIRSEDIGCHLA